jgi:four helix bundle protein
METQTSTASVGPIKDFKDLEVWQVARELRKEINRVASALSDFEKFALASQLRRASTSVTANLAEGFGRFGYQENAQLCSQARGSLYEVRDHLTTCVDEGYLEAGEGQRLDKLTQTVARLLNGYLRSTLARKHDEH